MLSDQEYKLLKEAAIEAKSLAYAPYSKFRVGASLLLNDGRVYKGANIENASYPAGICAERVLIPKVLTDGVSHKEFKALAVSTDSDLVSAPCGICRQVIREFAPKIPIYMFSKDGSCKETTLDELLPFSFGPEHLGL